MVLVCTHVKKKCEKKHYYEDLGFLFWGHDLRFQKERIQNYLLSLSLLIHHVNTRYVFPPVFLFLLMSISSPNFTTAVDPIFRSLESLPVKENSHEIKSTIYVPNKNQEISDFCAL